MIWSSDMTAAPRDGRKVDLWSFDAQRAKWGRRQNCIWGLMTTWSGGEYEGWIGLYQMLCDWQEPTHWVEITPPEMEG